MIGKMIRIGTSGWSYPEWRGSFYPPGLPARKHLAYLAERLPTVELNGSFYSLQRPTSYQSWYDQTPDDFCFAVKGGRYITHLKRLRNIDTAVANFFASGVLALGDKLGPLLWQLPADVRFDAALVRDFLDLLPRDPRSAADLGRQATLAEDRTFLTAMDDRPLRHAIEVRHESFRTDTFFDLLRERDIALVASDSAGDWPFFDYLTADFRYFRLHGHSILYVSKYSARSLAAWAEKILDRPAQDTYVYFDNTAKVAAPADACRLARLCGVSALAQPGSRTE